MELPRVLTGTHEGFDFEALRQGRNAQFNLPSLRIDGCDRACSEVHQICEEHEPALLRLVPDRHLPQGDGAPVGCRQAGPANHLIGEHGTAGRHRASRQNLVQHIGAWACDKPDPCHCPAMIEGLVPVAPIHRHNGAGSKRPLLRNTDIVGVAVGHEGPAGQTPLGIELELARDGSLGPLNPGPLEHRGTQLDDRRIQSPQRVLAPNPPSRRGRHHLTLGEHLIDERLVQWPRPMSVGLGQRRPGWRSPHAEVNPFAQAGRQAAADLSERLRAPHLATQHGDEMSPAAESLGRSLSVGLPHGTRKSRTIDQRQDLRKTTGNGSHPIPPACG